VKKITYAFIWGTIMIYKTFLRSALTAALLLGGSSFATAIPYSDVGTVDTFIQSAKLANSGDDFVQNWVEGVLGFEVAFNSDDKIDGYAAWQQVTGDPVGTDLWALAFDKPYDYFVVKTGNLQVTNANTFLYQNISDMAHGVIDLNNFGGSYDILVGKISHTSPYGGSTSVPEPSSLGLLAIGMLGLATARRFLNKA